MAYGNYYENKLSALLSEDHHAEDVNISCSPNSSLAPHECTVCGKQFKSAARLNVHCKMHSAQRHYVCSTCNRRFVDSSGLRAHLRIHTSDRPYACAMCSRTFTQVGNLRSHERTHTKSHRFVCTYCGKDLSRATHLRSHLLLHTGAPPVVCPECSEIFVVSRQLKLHRAKVHGIGALFVCPQCNKSFIAPSILRAHMSTHDRQKTVACHLCPKHVRTQRALLGHLANIHRIRQFPTLSQQDSYSEENVKSEIQTSTLKSDLDVRTEFKTPDDTDVENHLTDS